MAYGGYGRRRYNPGAEERREREAKAEARRERTRARFRRLMSQFRKVALRGEAASAAWKLKAVRSFTVGATRDGEITATLRTDGTHLYLQEPDYVGWKFYKLLPKHHVLRHGEEEEAMRDASRRRSPAARRRR